MEKGTIPQNNQPLHSQTYLNWDGISGKTTQRGPFK